MLVERGQRHSLGWQVTKKDGPCFVVARVRGTGSAKVLNRFPLTADGWTRAWGALVTHDGEAAQAVTERVQEWLAAGAARKAEVERQGQVYEMFANAAGATVFRWLGVQVLVGDESARLRSFAGEEDGSRVVT